MGHCLKATGLEGARTPESLLVTGMLCVSMGSLTDRALGSILNLKFLSEKAHPINMRTPFLRRGREWQGSPIAKCCLGLSQTPLLRLRIIGGIILAQPDMNSG